MLDRTRNEVRAAILQFAARRAYSLGSLPWWSKGIRISVANSPAGEAESAPGFPRSARSLPKPGPGSRTAHVPTTTVDIDLFRQLGKTVIRFRTDDRPDSAQVVYTLHAYLTDDRSYRIECPANCPHCSAPVSSVQANYCGRCGGSLVPHPEADAPSETDQAEAEPPNSADPADENVAASTACGSPVGVEDRSGRPEHFPAPAAPPVPAETED